jgi:hypothetical protein
LGYTHVGELKMAAPSEEKLIGDKFNLEALTVNQVKSFKALADGKDVFIGTRSPLTHCLESKTTSLCSYSLKLHA